MVKVGTRSLSCDLRLASAALLTGLAACAPDAATRLDDGTNPRQRNVPAAPIAPASPAPALLTPCAPGWREVPGPTLGDAVTCDPWPVGGVQTCAQSEAHFPGTPGCTRIGSDCPAGEWPEGLPANVPVLYVRAGGPSGGNGSTSSPFGSVSAALAAAAPGTILALGKGTFPEAVLLPARITLWGACVAQTNLALSTAGSTPTVSVVGDGAVVRNLRIGGPRPGVLIKGAGIGFQVQDLVIAGAQTAGMIATDAARVTGLRLVIRDTQPRAGDDAFGSGFEVAAGAQVDLKWVSFESNHTVGLYAAGVGTRIRLEDAALRDTLSELSSGAFGRGLSVQGHAKLEGQRVVLERNQDSAFGVVNSGEVRLTDAVIRETHPSTGDPDTGYGGGAASGSHVELHRVLLDRNRSSGLMVSEPRTSLLATDIVVRETLENLGSKAAGEGIWAKDGASVKATRVALERNRKVAVSAAIAGTVVDIEDATVRHTDEQVSSGLEGIGFAAQAGARMTVTRALVDESRCAGIVANDDGTVLTLVDVTVRGTRGCAIDGLLGRGLAVQSGASASATRLLLERNRSSAIFAASPGTHLTLTDVVGRDTVGELGDAARGGQYGEGLHAQQGAQVEVTRALFERSREVGVLCAAARIIGSDVLVRETMPTDCPPIHCDYQGGTGAAVLDDGSLVLEVFSLGKNAMAGLQLATGGTADLRRGEISDNPIGVNVQTKNFDLGRVQSEVVFRGNGANLSAEIMPLPPLPPR